MRNFGLLFLIVCFCAGCGEKLKVEKNLDPELEKAKKSFAAEVVKPKTEKEKIQEAAKAEAEKANRESEIAKTDSDPEAKLIANAPVDPESEAGTESEGSPDEAPVDLKVDARIVLNEAIATAKTDGKAVFVHFTADW